MILILIYMKSTGRRRITFTIRGIKAGFFFGGIIVCAILIKSANYIISYTSTDKYCMSCHIHPTADQSWKLSTHYNNRSGVITHCAECHLPPQGQGYLFAKAKHGIKDIYGYFFKDSTEINWEEKKLLENARGLVYEE